MISFHERQRFTQVWVWLIIAVTAVMAWTLFFLQVVGGEPVGDDPAPDWALWVFVAVMGVGFPVWFGVLTLETVVDEGGVHVRFRNGIGRRDVSFEEIVAVAVRPYRPLLEFGGWGLRFGRNRRRAFSVSGSDGVELTLTDGRRILIGSKRSDELEAAIRERAG